MQCLYQSLSKGIHNISAYYVHKNKFKVIELKSLRIIMLKNLLLADKTLLRYIPKLNK
jgi:hypothetical protein